MNARHVRVVAASALALVAFACQVVAGIDRVPKEPGDAGAPGDGGVDDPCKHATPPDRGEVKDDDRNGALPPFYLAVRRFDVSATSTGAYPGFDMDGVCTCDKRGVTAHGGTSSCTPKADDCDDDGGVDNRGIRLFNQFAPLGFSLDATINDGIDDGSRGLLIYVRDYNGKPNDSEIYVGAMLSHGIIDGSGCDSALGSNGRAPPKWCGHDRWSFPSAYVKPGSKEPVAAGIGWVKDGVVVFRSELALTAFFGSTTLSFGSPVTVGRVTQGPDGIWKLDAVLGGRIPVGELLSAAGVFKDPTTKGRLCSSPFFGTVKQAVCDAVDINHATFLDFADGPCDAVSMAVAFHAEQVELGDRLDDDAGAGACAADTVPPGTYSCP